MSNMIPDELGFFRGASKEFLIACEQYRAKAETENTPFYIYKPKLFPDGDMWCALLGPNAQEGVCGFGSNPNDAATAFNKAWYENLPKKDGANGNK